MDTPPPNPNLEAKWSISVGKDFSNSSSRDPSLNSKEWRSKVTIGVPLPRGKTVILELPQPSREVFYFGAFLASLQIVDGILTSIGIRKFGVSGEGNPLLRMAMTAFTPDQAIVLGKLLAILVVVGLTIAAKRVRFIRDMIGFLSCFYLVAAIIPWLYCLYVGPWLTGMH